MSERTNEEKLRILQERLAQIQEKKERKKEDKVDNKKHVAPVFEEDLVNENEIDPISPTPREPKNKSTRLKYFIIFFIISILGYGMYVFMFGSGISESFFSSNEIKEVAEEILDNEEIVYYQSDFNGKYIILLNSFESVSDANFEVKQFVNEGYDCNVFQLSGVSNSKEEIFQTYIGPFNKLEEANQYLNSSDRTQNTGKIITLQ
ncbi:MAG: hypothetical protein CMD02_01700 [Flavobacteriales bacterium]|nr:hypothetical protein [Flavobacteriales bacterium]|tara:strand:- start:15774 stop:16388 length:615 start_codon:yes stop_codon:yes gene_type:complete